MNRPEFDIIIRRVPGYGWLGLLVRDGREEYRTGGFQVDPLHALEACKTMAAKLWGEA